MSGSPRLTDIACHPAVEDAPQAVWKIGEDDKKGLSALCVPDTPVGIVLMAWVEKVVTHGDGLYSDRRNFIFWQRWRYF